MSEDAGTPAWRGLEMIGAGGAVASLWRSWLGRDFDPFQAAFLHAENLPARFVPCPSHCGCEHEVFPAGDHSFTAVCRCEPWNCDDLHLAAADLVTWKLHWGRLVGALAKALNLQSRLFDLGIKNTRQVGHWPAGSVPVWLSVQREPTEFHAAVIELCARVRRPFLLVSPTEAFMDAAMEERLTLTGAEWVSLEADFALTRDGALESRRRPADVFDKLQPRDGAAVEEDVARKALAAVRQMDQQGKYRSPSLITVFHLYCVGQLSTGEIARKCGCSKATVVSRLNLLRRRTGIAPDRLRQMSSHLEKVEETASDSRARHIHRENLVDEEEE